MQSMTERKCLKFGFSTRDRGREHPMTRSWRMAYVMACCLDEFGAYKWTLCAKEDIVCCVVSAIASDAGPALYSKYLQNRERDICKTSVHIQPQHTVLQVI